MDLVSFTVRRFTQTMTGADDRDWAVIVPSYLMVIVLLAYWSYAALTPLLSPSFDSPNFIVGMCIPSPQG